MPSIKFLIDLENPKTIFDVIENGILITDQNSITTYVNPAVTRITGYQKEEVENKNPHMFSSGHHHKDFYQDMWDAINKHGFWEGEIWNRRKSGQIYPEYLTITQIKQHEIDEFFYVGIFSDISFLKKDIEKKLHLAFYDPLTELANRNLFRDRLKKIVRHINDNTELAKNIALFYMDLDKFKQVNDTYGHYVGDKLLHCVGKRLHSITRAHDTIARIGGDEFAVIFTSASDIHSAIDFAKRIVSSIEKPFQIDDHTIQISISIGISSYPEQAKDIDSLLVNADKAMYLAKKLGSKVECFRN